MTASAIGLGVGLGLLLALAGCGRPDGAAASGAAASGAAAEPSGARIEAGRKLFARCASCHEVGPNAVNGFGPQLNGILGREAGAAPGYSYSPAMKASALVWDAASLAAFIRDSEQVIPGNKMRFMSFMSQEQAGQIVAYLATHGRPATGEAPSAERQ